MTRELERRQQQTKGANKFWSRKTWWGTVTDQWNCVSGEAGGWEDRPTWPIGTAEGFCTWRSENQTKKLF